MYFNRKCTHVTAYETDATMRLLDLSLAPRERGELSPASFPGRTSVTAQIAFSKSHGARVLETIRAEVVGLACETSE